MKSEDVRFAVVRPSSWAARSIRFHGLEHKDGVLGCTHPRSWVKKRDDMHTEAIGEMGLDMGIEMDLSTEELNRAIEICEYKWLERMVGDGSI